ncbi:outer membrane tyrosine kinase [Campylobacter jejuni]|uniref:Outer membrane tyrosine kinase n=1 Tax=Campylobacter jejuni TaxID=197 RepID=A0A5Y8Y8R1_CAMJU|nr:outer membrane tyrosine kinase [Campylobacter jejuni]ECL9334744.1 outer membrane tyrosine kinase [Campylobacter jejuni]ECQ5723173.1 outer membrane tyrosine kinase [Campylobacter jejuni]ECQ5996852.1 outer membrane tyrosine kinase [Campylobacter jejuni]ECZ4176711.1 outer membrane tyrosine kinase [Campylobacter jejuni]MBZ8183496.1 outer membrane tyrosine kinase [Campylobacter jejuni subsp. jejuni]
MKTKFSLILSACLLSSSLFAKNTDDEITKLQKQLAQIQAELAQIRKEREAQAKQNEAVKAELADLNDRADETEFQAALSKVKFGLEFSTAVSNTNYKVSGQDYSANNKWMNELHLNMNADINDKTKFYGRLSMAKNWSQMGWSGSPLDLDAGRNTRSSGPVLYVDRAYLDYYITPEWIATIGRQPGTDGPGSNLRNNALRQSTYPALAINALGDAAVITYKPESLQDHKVAIRAAYGKTYQWDEEGKIRDWMSDQKDADANLYYAAVEGELPIEGMGDNLIIFNVAHMTDFALPIPGSILLDDDEVVNLGNLTLANIHFENYKAFGTNFNWFASLGYSNGSNNEINPLLSATLQGKGYGNGKFNEKDGYAVHVGGRYDFTKALKVGYEFFWGSRYWYTMSRPSINDPLNIRMTRGTAHDFYVIYQLDRYQFLRLSYTNIQNIWGNRGLPFGGAKKDKARADNIMLMYNVKF